MAADEKRSLRLNRATDVKSFLKFIFALPGAMGIRCFRGQANTSWRLRPSVMRDLKSDAESNIISELMTEAASEFSNDKTMFERLVRAQHYGLPTRLLDVSLNPLVALYFACADEHQQKNDGKVIILDFKRQFIRYPDSDTVSLICNLSRLSEAELDDLKKSVNRDKISREQLRDHEAAKRLTWFVKMEKPYFENMIDPSDFRRYFFIHASKVNKRIAAQSGAFVAAGLLSYAARGSLKSFTTVEIIVESEAKEKILKELDQLNINLRSLFPEIEYTSHYIKKKWEKEKTSDKEDLFVDIFG